VVWRCMLRVAYAQSMCLNECSCRYELKVPLPLLPACCFAAAGIYLLRNVVVQVVNP
jgi:hypothetical protein